MEGVEAWRDCGDDGVMGSLVSVYSFSRCAPTTRPVHFIIQYSLLLPPHTTTILTHRLATHLVPSFASRLECVEEATVHHAYPSTLPPLNVHTPALPPLYICVHDALTSRVQAVSQRAAASISCGNRLPTTARWSGARRRQSGGSLCRASRT